MATTVNLTTTYAGELAGEILMAAKIANPSMDLVTLKPNVPYKLKYRKVSNSFSSFEAPTCDFTPLGTVDLTESTLTVEKFMIQRNICKETFLADWTAKDVMSGRMNAELQAAIAADLATEIMSANETIMWQGVNATTGQYDGFGTIIDADAGNDVNFVASPVALTSSNIVAKIDALIAAMPVRVKAAAEKPCIYMNVSTWELFMQAQIAAGNGWYANLGPAMAGLKYMGLYEIRVCPGIAANTMYFAQPSNLVLGTWVESDYTSIQILDMADKDLSENIRLKASFFFGTLIPYTAEVAAYGPGLS